MLGLLRGWEKIRPLIHSMGIQTNGTTPNQIPLETTLTCTGIGMKLWGLNRSALAASLLAPIVLTAGCQKSAYYVGDLKEHQLLGTWVMAAIPGNVPRPPVPQADCQLTLSIDGSFEARNFPLVVDPSPKAKVRYVTERGTWKLADNSALGTRSRWNLNLNFSTSRFDINWDVTGSSKALRLFGLTDVDYAIGFEFIPTANK